MDSSQETIVGDNLFDETAPSHLADNSEKNIAWVERMFNKWVEEQREKTPEFFSCDLRNLLQHFKPVINDYLPKFLADIRKTDGSTYPPKTLLYIFKTISMLANKLNLGYNLLKDNDFDRTRRYLNDMMKRGTQSGYQPPKKQG